MSVQFYKNGIITAGGSGINPNLIINSANISGSHLTSGNEYIALNLGQSYMDVPNGTQVTFSFDLELKVVQQHSTASMNVYFNIYNTNNKGPKTFGGVNIGTSQVFVNVTPGDVVKKRVHATTTIQDRESPATSSNWIEFYTGYGSGNVFKVSNLKCELGSVATLWIPNENDAIYISATQGFVEHGNMMKIYKDNIETTEFIEY